MYLIKNKVLHNGVGYAKGSEIKSEHKEFKALFAGGHIEEVGQRQVPQVSSSDESPESSKSGKQSDKK